MAKRKPRKSFYSPGRIVMGVLFGSERNWPTWPRVRRTLFGHKDVVSIRRGPEGTVKARGAVRTPDGWKRDKGKRARTYRPGQTTKPRAAKRTDARAGKRGAERTARTGRSAEPVSQANPNLRRHHRQSADGRLQGSLKGGYAFPSVPQTVGLDGLRCDWCRGTNVRALFTGSGRLKKVIGVAPCAHAWAVPDGGPGQQPPGPGDKLLCAKCSNTGSVTVKIKHRSGTRLSAPGVCPTCRGWILHW